VVECDEMLIAADACDLMAESGDAVLVQRVVGAVIEYPYYHESVRTFPSLILELVNAHDVVR
jgi:sulfur transfer complex TusBCD TusB component (DsrH family)